MPSDAFLVFNRSTVKEVTSLADIFATRNRRPGPNTDYGLLHGGLILLVSGWETYCADVSKEAVSKIAATEELKFSEIPDGIRRQIILHAYTENLPNKDPLQTDLSRLPDDGWKDLLSEMVLDFLRDFNTPKFQREKGKSLRKLFKSYLDTDVENCLSELTGIAAHPTEIDRLIGIRGDVAHRGKPKAADRFYANDLKSFISIFRKACAGLDSIIWHEFRRSYNMTPWRMTQTVTTHLPGYPRIDEILE